MKCPFCDFYTRPDTNPSEKNAYTKALLHELTLADRLGWSSKASTLYFGGGTPSLASLSDLSLLIEAIDRRMGLVPEAEITLEVNPEDVTPSRAEAWIKMGINRFSLGAQAVTDADLERLGRNHRAEHNLRAMDLLRDSGAQNIGIDLMFGLENQSLDDWIDTLSKVVSWNPEHISCYNLTIEEKTLFAVEYEQGKLRLPPDETQATMLLSTREILKHHGYPAYEISNFAKPGRRSAHNLAYWTGHNYWGLGVSAHSMQRRAERIRRFWHPRSLSAYINGVCDPSMAIETEDLTQDRHFRERVMTGLRLTEGIHLGALKKDLGIDAPQDVVAALRQGLDQGSIEKNGETYALTPHGILFSDSIFADLF